MHQYWAKIEHFSLTIPPTSLTLGHLPLHKGGFGAVHPYTRKQQFTALMISQYQRFDDHRQGGADGLAYVQKTAILQHQPV